MNVTVQVKVPLPLVIKLETLLTQMKVLHDAEIEQLAKKLKMAGPTETYLAQQAKLRERGKRLTINYLVRAALMKGAEKISNKAEDVLELIAADPVKEGRPSGTRAA